MKTFNCEHCGVKVTRIECVYNRYKHHFCSAKCYHESTRGKPNYKLRKRINKVCLICGQKFEVKRYKKNTRKYCSNECSYKGQIGHLKWWNNPKKRLKTIRKLYKEGKLVGYWKGKKRGTSPNKVIIPQDELFELYCTKKWSSIKIAKHFKVAKVTILGLLKEHGIARRNLKEARKELLKDPNFVRELMKRFNVKPNKLEKRLIQIIKKHNLPFKYVGDGQVIISGLCPDFIQCNGKKKIIEFFGDYWHNPKKREISWRYTEFGRKAVYSQLGYDTLVIWEHDLNKLPEEEIVNKIKQFGGVC